MLPVIDLAIESIKKQQIIPPFLKVSVTFYDDQCDASYATVSTMDGTSKDCGHVLFGPSCDYALGKSNFYSYILFKKIRQANP